MKFDSTLRPQDKKTIGIVLFIAVVALFCWYMIRPAWIQLGDLDDKIKTAEATKQEYKMKTMNLGTAEILYDKATTDINNSTKDFYDVMDNSEIEKMGTEYILRFGLMPVDFSVNLRDGSFVSESPYAYASIRKPVVSEVETPEAVPTTSATETATSSTVLDVKSLQVYYSQARSSVSSTTKSEVECATISIVVQGPENKCQAMIDDITKNPSIRVTGYSWNNAREIWSEDADGNRTLMNSGFKELRIELNLYMTEKPHFENKEG